MRDLYPSSNKEWHTQRQHRLPQLEIQATNDIAICGLWLSCLPWLFFVRASPYTNYKRHWKRPKLQNLRTWVLGKERRSNRNCQYIPSKKAAYLPSRRSDGQKLIRWEDHLIQTCQGQWHLRSHPGSLGCQTRERRHASIHSRFLCSLPQAQRFNDNVLRSPQHQLWGIHGTRRNGQTSLLSRDIRHRLARDLAGLHQTVGDESLAYDREPSAATESRVRREEMYSQQMSQT